MSAPPPPAPSSLLRRLLLALVVAGVGFVAVWQGFGLAGFGTDVHPSRAGAALVALFLCALPVVWPEQWRAARVAAAVIGLGTAGYAWWEFRSSDFKNAMSLHEAARARDYYRERLTVATAEEAEKTDGMRGARAVQEQYPSLCKGLAADYDRWAGAVADDIASRYEKLPRDDFPGAEALVKPAKALAAAHPASAGKLDAARAVWRAEALLARVGELLALPRGDWDAFNRTASGRRRLVESLPDTRDRVARAETDWIDASVEGAIAKARAVKPGEPAPGREVWKQLHWDLLALKSLDTADGRFAAARGRLFKAAHEGAKEEALGHFEAGRYDRAFGIARAHAVDWAATAELLGAAEQKALTELRGTYEFFDALAARSAAPVEVAPLPRAKP